jgi:hypothetical protein
MGGLFMGLFPALMAGYASYLKSKQKPEVPPDLSMPTAANQGVLLAQEKERRAATVRRGRQSTNITGGLSGSKPTLGTPGLWGV